MGGLRERFRVESAPNISATRPKSVRVILSSSMDIKTRGPQRRIYPELDNYSLQYGNGREKGLAPRTDRLLTGPRK